MGRALKPDPHAVGVTASGQAAAGGGRAVGGGAEGLECSCCPHHPLGAGIWTGATSGPDPRVGAHGVGSGTPLSVASTPAWRRGGRGPHRPGSQLPGELPVAILPCKGMLPEGIWVSVGFLTLTPLWSSQGCLGLGSQRPLPAPRSTPPSAGSLCRSQGVVCQGQPMWGVEEDTQ